MASEMRTGRRGGGPQLLTAAALLSVLAGFAGVYVTLTGPDNARPLPGSPLGSIALANAADAKAEPLPTGPGANPYSVGQMTAFVFRKPEELPQLGFVDESGRQGSQKDWAGRVVLLNLWATWCAPCRKEMPGLDRLQAALGSDKFEVVALSVDRGGIAASRKFYDQIKIEKLKLYVDASARATTALKAIGLPVTLLIKDGREIGRLVGPAEWDAPEAKRLIEAALR